jgi:hypothetical protein
MASSCVDVRWAYVSLSRVLPSSFKGRDVEAVPEWAA